MAATLQADAFKRLYSEEYLDKFMSEGLRPDGRGLGVCRPVTVATNAVSSADGSAIAKVCRDQVAQIAHCIPQLLLR